MRFPALRHRRLTQLLRLGFGLMLVCMIGTFEANLFASTEYQAITDRLIHHIYPAREQARIIVRLMLSIDDDGAWYVLSHSPRQQASLLQRYQQEVEALRQAIAQAGVLADTPTQRLALTDVTQFFFGVGGYDATNQQIFAQKRADQDLTADDSYVRSPFLSVIQQNMQIYTNVVESEITEESARQNSLANLVKILNIGFGGSVSLFGLGIALFVKRAIERLYQEIEDAMEQTEQEMLHMADAQLQLLPREFPTVLGLEIYAHCCPAREVGGDFYTFNNHASGHYVFAIGDVSGKGLRSALLMAMVRTIIHVTVKSLLQLEPQVIVSKTNEYLYDDLTLVGMFVTIFVSCYDPVTQRLAYANAGHSPVIYCPADGPARFLDADVPVIGVLPTLAAQENVVRLAPGDVLVMATDGLSEAHNTEGALFGYERLLTLVTSLQQESAHTIAESLLEAVNHFSVECDQFDDQTVVVVKGVAR